MGVWAERARREIVRVLMTLPVSATRDECRRALSDDYPFGPRENHPYKVWLREVKAALDARFGARHEARPEARPEVGYLVSERQGRLWLSVRCGWCADLDRRTGCLVCAPRHQAVAEVVKTADFRRLSAAGGPVGLAALLDLCEETLGERPAAPGGV